MKNQVLTAAIAACLTFSTAYAWNQPPPPPPKPADVKINVSPDITASLKAAADAKAAASAASQAAAGVFKSGNSENNNILKATTGDQKLTLNAPVSTQVKAAGGTGTAGISGSANTTNSYMGWDSVQVAPPVPFYGSATIEMQPNGLCGPRVIIAPFKHRGTHTPQLLGLFSTFNMTDSKEGIYKGVVDGSKKDPFFEIVEFPTLQGTVVVSYGHQLWIAKGVDSEAGSAGSAGNYVDQKMVGGGASQSAGSAHGIIGDVATRCEFEKFWNPTVAGTPSPWDPPVPKPAPVVAPPVATTPLPDERDKKIKDQAEIILRMGCRLDIVPDRTTCPPDAKPVKGRK